MPVKLTILYGGFQSIINEIYLIGNIKSEELFDSIKNFKNNDTLDTV